MKNRTGHDSQPGESKVAENSILGISLFCAIALLWAKNLSGLLKAIKKLEKCFYYPLSLS